MAAGFASVLLRRCTVNASVRNGICYQIRWTTAPGMPTTLSRLEASQYAPIIDSYSARGFDVRGTKFIGSLALLPRALFNWKVSRVLFIFTEVMHVHIQYVLGRISS